jgi:putative radical SAM enzyme (TIGR03279 family)
MSGFLIARQELQRSITKTTLQIGNGVGSIRQFLKQFQDMASEKLPPRLEAPQRFTWVVGNAVEKAFAPLVQQLNAVEGLEVRLAALRSDYWGQEITVTGLLTGQDLLEGLKGKDLGNAILLPSLMLKQGDTLFLDDMKVEDVACQLGIPILPVNGIEELIETCIKTGLRH